MQVSQNVDINPDPGKLPGGPQIQQLLDGLGGWALFAALAGLLISVIVWAMGSFGGNYHAVSNGKTGVLVCGAPPSSPVAPPRSSTSSRASAPRSDDRARVPRRPHARNDGRRIPLGCRTRAVSGGTSPARAAPRSSTPGWASITRSTAAGADTVLGQIVKTVDESTQVPLADPSYRHVYSGFLGLAAPLIGVILCAALSSARYAATPAPSAERLSASRSPSSVARSTSASRSCSWHSTTGSRTGSSG